MWAGTWGGESAVFRTFATGTCLDKTAKDLKTIFHPTRLVLFFVISRLFCQEFLYDYGIHHLRAGAVRWLES